MCLAGPKHLDQLGVNHNNLIPCSKQVTAIGSSKLKCSGWLTITFQLNGHQTNQPLFICDKTDQLYFCKKGCVDLNILNIHQHSLIQWIPKHNKSQQLMPLVISQITIVYIGMSTFLKNTSSLFFTKPPILKSTNCPSPPPFLGNTPYILVFHELRLKIGFFIELP